MNEPTATKTKTRRRGRPRDRKNQLPPEVELMRRHLIFLMKILNGDAPPPAKARNRGAARGAKVKALRDRAAREAWQRRLAFTNKRKPVHSQA